MKYISVVIPCYNEEDNLKRGVLEKVFAYFENKKYEWEVIVTDDGSTDKSGKIASERIKKLKNFRLLKNPHGGKPSALLYGIKKAKGKYVLFTDMDQSTPIKELDKFLKFTREGYEVVIGSRGIKRKNFPFYRRMGAVLFMAFRKALILPEIDDTQCGFKLIKTDLLRKTFPELDYFKNKKKVKGWKVTSYDVELLHMLKKEGARIKEVRVVWDDQDTSQSKGGYLKRYIKESLDMIKQILKVKLNDIRGRY